MRIGIPLDSEMRISVGMLSSPVTAAPMLQRRRLACPTSHGKTHDGLTISSPTAAATSRPVTVASVNTASTPVVVVLPVVSTTTAPTWTRFERQPTKPSATEERILTLARQYHPGYFGKVGMRYFHKQQSHFWKPTINLDKVHTPPPTVDAMQKLGHAWPPMQTKPGVAPAHRIGSGPLSTQTRDRFV